jgi:ATP-dependent helicase/nuclease subunit A
VLRQMGIPVREDNPEGWLACEQVRDVLALLQVLDNAQQDIPLAAVLRSPLCPGGSLQPDDLIRIRLADRKTTFHCAVRSFARTGRPTELRDRLQSVLVGLDEWGQMLRHQNLAEAIWTIYQQSHLLAHAVALPDGRQRQADLLELHERARMFSRHARPTLGRFVRFLTDLESRAAESRGVGLVPADNAVHVTTIHQAKGLEFAVVIVPDLAKQFNLEDAQGMVTYERKEHVGLRAVDPATRRTWPTFTSQQTADAGLRETLAEEARILYVAMTRAKERLVLIGRADERQVESARGRWAGRSTPIGAAEFRSARRPMDWLLASLAMQPADIVRWDGDQERRQEIRVTLHDSDEFTAIESEPAATELQPAPEPVPGDGELAARIIRRLEFRYPFAAMTDLPAARAASELKTLLADAESEALDRWPAPSADRWRRPVWTLPTELVASPEVRGRAVHALLEHLDLARPCDGGGLQVQLDELVAGGSLPAGVLTEDDLAGVAWWFATDLGRLQRSCRDELRREMPFILVWQPDVVLAESRRDDAEDFTLVRGIIDAAWPMPNGSGWVLIDYKTDAVTGSAVGERAAYYQPQLAVYADAIERIWRVRVAESWLVFLSARQLVPSAGRLSA